MQFNWWRSVVLFFFICVTTIAAQSQIFTRIADFDDMNSDSPAAPLIRGINGYFLGTTERGGKCCGKIIEADSNGGISGVQNFDQTNGSLPTAGIVQGPDGSLYGTAGYGGAYQHGTVFKVTHGNVLQALHDFDSTDGMSPFSGLIQGSDGNFYGTTTGGGNSNCSCGTVFRITSSGLFTTLYSFSGTDGAEPFYSTPIQGDDGNLYGTTYEGGSGTYCEYSGGCGTVYKITSNGVLTTLYDFCSQPGCLDGAGPQVSLVEGIDGKFYGTTIAGGEPNCDGIPCGTIFRISRTGNLNILHNFDGTDGAPPFSSLIQGTDGNLYGTTYGGGSFSCSPDQTCGTIYKMTTKGSLTTLHIFSVPDGVGPVGGLMQNTDGLFYGTTTQGGYFKGPCGGLFGCGTIFSLNMGLGPFVKTLSQFGRVGSPAIILGDNLAEATGVSFNGTLAPFKVVSPTEIKSQIPKGATTGYVTVSFANYSLKSNVPFIVR